MPPAGVLVVCALAGMAYWFVGRPIVHVVKKIDHPICHVVTLGQKCKPATKKESK